MSIRSNNDTVYSIIKGSSKSSFLHVTKPNYIDIYNVRISPQKITFMGAFDGKKFTEQVTIRNLGNKNVVIRVGTPTSFAFHVQGDGGKTILAPGLAVTRSISYTCKITQSILKTHFPIHIDNNKYNYLIDVLLAQPYIVTDPGTIDFGVMNLGQSPIIRELIIKNIGDKTTTFKVDYAISDVNIVISPSHGELSAKSSLKMNLSLIHAPLGYHIREFWIKCDPKPIRVTIEIVVIKKKLSIIHEHSSPDLTLVKFPMTFRGCQRYDTFLLKNSSATPTTFVILLEHNQSLYNLENKDKEFKDLANFEIKPTSGMLCPFEERIVLLSYKPQNKLPKKGWKHDAANEIEHSIFLRLMNVQDNLDKDKKSGVTFILKSDNKLGGQKSTSHLFAMKAMKSSLSILPDRSDGLYGIPSEAVFNIHSYEEPKKAQKIRLCLNGISESIELIIEPNEFIFDVLKTTEPIKRVICLKNKSKFQDVLFVYIKHPYIFVNPTKGVLPPNKSIDIEVIIKPKTAGIFETCIEFEAKAMTSTISEKTNEWITLNTFQCALKYTISTDIYKKEHKPIFNTGLVPKNTVHPVGKNINAITFTSNIPKPKCAVYDVHMCPKHKTSLSDQCLIAFPNDVIPKSMLPSQNSKYRTIFAGIPRNTELISTSKRDEKTKKLQYYYNHFIRKNSQKKNSHCQCCNFNGSVNVNFNPCSCCDKLYNLNLFDNFKSNSMKPTILKLAVVDDHDCPRSFTYFPLTPIQLFNIQVAPHHMKFGKVSIDLATNEQLSIVNFNNFKIKLELKSTHPEITFPVGSIAYVNSQSRSNLLIRFHSKILGKVHKIINYIINDSHSFDIDIFTEVTEKHLIIQQKIIEFNQNNIDRIFSIKSMPITIINPVNSFTSFNFILPDQLRYKVIPAKGIVPPHSNIVCHLYRQSEHNLKSHTEITLVPESGRYESLIVKCDVIIPSINLINSTIDVGTLPLNILKIYHAFLNNPSQLETTYLVLDPKPISGVTIERPTGIIRPKSITILYIYFQIRAIISFDFIVNIQIQNTHTIHLRIRGKVAFPHVKIKPNKIKLRRISADSFDRMAFALYNCGETEVSINIPLSSTYNEFVVSESSDEIISPYENQEIFLPPNTSKKLYVHFNPKDVASYEFYLPVIINRIIGPVILEDEQLTINPIYHLRKQESKHLENCSYIEDIPNELSVLRITVTVQSHILQISKKNIHFYYSPLSTKKNMTCYEVTIKNVSTKIRDFLLRTDSLQNMPYILQASGKHIEQTDIALIQSTYLPRDEVKLNIWFSPLQPGKYVVKLPIYVHNYARNSRVYNYITLDGVYPEPNISTNIDKIYFGPVPLGIINERLIYIKAENYYIMEELIPNSTSKFITITFPEGNSVQSKDEEPINLPIIISFKSDIPVSLSETVTITDRFGNKCIIDVYACADNCILTTHEFLAAYPEFIEYKSQTSQENINRNNLESAPNLILKKSSLKLYSSVIKYNEAKCNDICIDFPKYPDSSTKPTDISNYLDKVVYKIEMFFYERFFRYEYFSILPDGILAMVNLPYREKNDSRKLNPKEGKYFSIFQYISRAYGDDASCFFSKGPIPTDNIERVQFVFILFKQMVDFVEAQGGCIKHIDPKFLLSYDDYKILMKMTTPRTQLSTQKTPLCDRKTFYRYCKRFWLDLILQSLKVKLLPFVNQDSLATHAKIVDESQPNVNRKQNDFYKMSNIRWILSHQSIRNLNPLESNIYNLHERILLAWLNRNFELHRQSIWTNSQCVPPRCIRNFDKDLSDALPFVFVTMSYCPYLEKEYFNDLFTHATTPEMAYHNAARVVKAWQDLSLGITVTPNDIVENNSVSMLLLVIFLYFTLPEYLPSSLIHFKTNLSEITVRCIKISTPRDTNYKICFINNDHKCFYTNQDNNLISVTDKGFIIRLFYHARQIAHTMATLILVGEVSQGVFSSSLVLSLEGEPLLTSCQTIVVTAPLYDNIEQIVSINVPYTCAGDFAIFCTDDEIHDIATFVAYPWIRESLRKIPRKLYIKETVLKHTGGKTARLHLYLSFLFAETSDHYLVFVNKEIGDFIIHIKMTPTQLKKYIYFTYKISSSCCSRKCMCKNRSKTEFENCPCVINIPISKRNKYWWECFRKSQRQALPRDEWSFWDERLDTNIGERLVQWLLNEDSPMAPQKLKIYKVKETYSIEDIGTMVGDIIHPKKLYIEDMDTDGEVDLPIISHQPGRYVLQLKSEDELEIRSIVITLSHNKCI